MNKRIRELDAQAVEYALGVCDANGLYQGKEYLQVVKERFAYLLLEDVMQTLFVTGHELAFDELNKHFGVEE